MISISRNDKSRKKHELEEDNDKKKIMNYVIRIVKKKRFLLKLIMQ